MIVLPSRVPNYTTKLIAPKVETMPELWRWSRVSWRHGRSMPEILTLPDLGWYSRSVKLIGDIKWCPGLLRLVVVAAAMIVRPTMGLGTRQSNEGSSRNGGGAELEEPNVRVRPCNLGGARTIPRTQLESPEIGEH